MDEVLRVSTLREAHSRRRVDLLRRALREGLLDDDVVANELAEWVQLFRLDPQPGLRTLILVALEGTEDPAFDEILRRGWTDRGDGVRLEALRQLLDRAPERRRKLVDEALEDPSLEVQLLGAQALYDADAAEAVATVLRILEREAPCERGSHALRRCSEILAEEFVDPAAVDGLRRLARDLDDPEGHLSWALEVLQRD